MIRRSALLVLALLVAGCSGGEATVQPITATTAELTTTTTTAEVIQADPIALLAEQHLELWRRGEGLVAVVSFDASLADKPNSPVEVHVDEYLWRAGRGQPEDEITVTGLAGFPKPPEESASTVVLVDGDGKVRSVGFFGPDGEALKDVGRIGSGVLGLTAQSLYDEGYERGPRSACDGPLPQANSPLDALRRYFGLYGDVPEIEAQERQREVDRAAQAEPTVPVEIILPEDGALTTLATFFDMSDDRFLGAVNLSGSYDVLPDGTSVFVPRTVLLMKRPENQGDVGVYIRSETGVTYSCPPTNTEIPVMIVPYDDIAGSQRATIDLVTNTYRPFDGEG